MVFFHFFHFRMVYKGKTKTHEARAIALRNIQGENEVFLIFTGFLIYNDDIYQFTCLEYLCGILLFTYYLYCTPYGHRFYWETTSLLLQIVYAADSKESLA